MRALLRRLLGKQEAPTHAKHLVRHLTVPEAPAALYAIGDVHGCLDELVDLEHQIIADGHSIPGSKLLVMLGDYVDRGPDSAAVIDHLLSRPPEGFRRVCLMGNHELMFRDFLTRPHPQSNWLEFGGLETLRSYGISNDALKATRPSQWPMLIKAHIPDNHLDFLASLSWTLQVPGWLFVHAGIQPGIPLEAQKADDLFWIREAFYDLVDHEDCSHFSFRVVHGHTPAADPVITRRRICIDTGAYATGRLTSLRITPDGSFQMLQTSPSPGRK
ncbi:serine/threonine protein phosphatase 1 [Devosia subaequoris]|uniref:Serine/threonine protein phosphatase 1 n=1 Tax=Devosia subaequoris TaxID=395930 RepID=A0A7W6NCL1_9HYPH|nr:metallophosphoesterase family protein [Devosia subaequoris]MBB4053769.1 serine/threonine protein phosphatase 1 [Devosia subaequoris]MCP1211033.1 serine/threonine protein phosphatase [Devosia subaequoris]